MNTHEERAPDYLLDILEALGRILRYTKGVSADQFLADQMMQDAVVRNIGIVGEAAKQMSDIAPVFSSQHPEIPFAEVYGMRNRVIHGYASVNPAVVWDSVRNDVPAMQRQILSILESLGVSTDSL